jgi:outer membrane lipoprotein-sorting protein
MKLKLKVATSLIASAICISASVSAQAQDTLPSADRVVTTMMKFDAQRQSGLTGYAATRHYVAVNKNRHAEMVVHVTCDSNGAKQFTILGEEGAGSIRKHVFYKLLSEETEASRRGTRSNTRLTPDNYDFKIIGKETLETGPAYVLAVTPKRENKYLINGKIWVDENDYSIVRIEGQPARNPSFWVRSVHFVHTYEKVGPFWFASSTHTTSEIRIFGESELTIENSNYTLNPPNKSETTSIHLENEVRLGQ